MALATFAPSIRPSPGATSSRTVNLTQAEFGDGYTLAAPKGLNHMPYALSLKWDGLTLAQLDEIDGFLAAQGGYKPFYYNAYTLPTGLKWTCKEWSTSRSVPFSLQAKFEQNFTLLT